MWIVDYGPDEVDICNFYPGMLDDELVEFFLKVINAERADDAMIHSLSRLIIRSILFRIYGSYIFRFHFVQRLFFHCF